MRLPRTVLERAKSSIDYCVHQVQKIKTGKVETFNVIELLDDISNNVSSIIDYSNFVIQESPNKKLIDSGPAGEIEEAKFMADSFFFGLNLDKDIYKILKYALHDLKDDTFGEKAQNTNCHGYNLYSKSERYSPSESLQTPMDHSNQLYNIIEIGESMIKQYHNIGMNKPIQVRRTTALMLDEITKLESMSLRSSQNGQKYLKRLFLQRHKLATSILKCDSYADISLKKNIFSTHKSVIDFLKLDSNPECHVNIEEFFEHKRRNSFLAEKNQEIDIKDYKINIETVWECLKSVTGSLLDVRFEVSRITASEYHLKFSEGDIFVRLKNPDSYNFGKHYIIRTWRDNFNTINLFHDINGIPQTPLAAIIIPTDSLCELTFGSIRTLFHEFGHALHTILSRTEYHYLSGTRGSMELAEVPAYIFESLWCMTDIVSEFWNTMPIRLINQHKKWIADKNIKVFDSIESKTISIIDQMVHGPDAHLSIEKYTPLISALNMNEHLVSCSAHCYSYVLAQKVASIAWRTKNLSKINSIFRSTSVAGLQKDVQDLLNLH